MSYRPEKIISGGQTGSDIGAIVAAKDMEILTGGWAPLGFKTEKGPQPVLASYGLLETEDSGYNLRTELNVCDSDATLIFARNPRSKGTLLTMQCAMRNGKPFSPPINPTDPDAYAQVSEFLLKHRPAVLNVAGNRESVAPGIARQVVDLLTYTLEQLNSPVVTHAAG